MGEARCSGCLRLCALSYATGGTEVCERLVDEVRRAFGARALWPRGGSAAGSAAPTAHPPSNPSHSPPYLPLPPGGGLGSPATKALQGVGGHAPRDGELGPAAHLARQGQGGVLLGPLTCSPARSVIASGAPAARGSWASHPLFCVHALVPCPPACPRPALDCPGAVWAAEGRAGGGLGGGGGAGQEGQGWAAHQHPGEPASGCCSASSSASLAGP